MQVKNSRIPSRQEVKPFFQPILSLQNQEIIGYETLGRHVREHGVESLGPFFHNPDIPEEIHLRIDRHLREQAIQRLAATADDSLLFINLKPSWIYRTYRRTGRLPTIQFLKKHRVDPSRIVIEITEEEFTGDLHELTWIVEQYREVGCTIAIDDVGSGFSNFDRIASLRPKILKIDLNLMKKSLLHDGYKAVMQSFSILAAQMGASLLVEGIETKQELQSALQVGARYVQGYLFAKAERDLLPKQAFKAMLKEEMKLFGRQEFERYNSLLTVPQSLDELIHASYAIASAADADKLIEQAIAGVSHQCIRIYICREDGYQTSSNYTRREEGWVKDESYRGANWTWRPFFISNILMMSRQKQGILSQPYTDLDTSQSIQTYSCALSEGYYLFLDLLI